MEISKHTERTKPTVQQRDEATLIFDQQPGRTALVNGKEYLFFSGYSYLGMQQCPDFIQLVKEGTEKFGWSFPSSRISNTRLGLFDSFEEKLSSLTGFRQTVAVSNGYTAGRLAVQLFAHKANFFVAPYTHPAVSEGLPKYQGSYESWKNFVITSLNEQQRLTLPVIVTDSVNPLRGEVNDLSFLQYIERKCICIVDDSHGIGLIGEKGSGISKTLPENPHIDYVLIYSLSKAFNLNGGAISSNNRSYIEQWRNLPAYTGGTGMNPALMYAFSEANNMYAEQREKLKQNVRTFASMVKNKTSLIHPSAELPVFLFNTQVNEEELIEKNIIISSFPYPDPAGKKIQRVVVNALHTEDDLDLLAAAIR